MRRTRNRSPGGRHTTEPRTGFEPVTSSLPRKCSTTELSGQRGPGYTVRRAGAKSAPRPARSPGQRRAGAGRTRADGAPRVQAGTSRTTPDDRTTPPRRARAWRRGARAAAGRARRRGVAAGREGSRVAAGCGACRRAGSRPPRLHAGCPVGDTAGPVRRGRSGLRERDRAPSPGEDALSWIAWRVRDSNPRRRCQLIYSQPPLATRVTRRGCACGDCVADVRMEG